MSATRTMTSGADLASPVMGTKPPGVARLRFGIAGLLRRSERLVDRMVSAYERVCCLDEQDTADIYLAMGNDFARSGRADEAIKALRQTLELRPQDPRPWFQLGALYLQQGGAESACAAFEKAQQLGLDCFELHLQWADALTELKKQEEAAEALRRALGHQPEAAEATYRLAVVLDQLKRHEEAVEAFKRAIELAPREVSYHQSLGFTYESMGQRDEAIECFKRALELERRGSR